MKLRIWRTPTLESTSIDVLEVSQRSTHGLKRNHIMTIGDLLDHCHSREELCKLDGIGKASAINIINALADYFISTLSDEEYERYLKEMEEINIGDSTAKAV